MWYSGCVGDRLGSSSNGANILAPILDKSDNSEQKHPTNFKIDPSGLYEDIQNL